MMRRQGGQRGETHVVHVVMTTNHQIHSMLVPDVLAFHRSEIISKINILDNLTRKLDFHRPSLDPALTFGNLQCVSATMTSTFHGPLGSRSSWESERAVSFIGRYLNDSGQEAGKKIAGIMRE
jgi:hypothetical protein